MNKKILLIVYLACLVLLNVSNTFSKGQHKGEQKMLDVNVIFSDSSGKTITNSEGIFYHFYGYVFHEDKVYPPEYWGEYPLYFFGRQVGVTVTVTNKGPREKAKLRIITESYVLKTDGSSGMALMEPKIIDIEVLRGETKTIDFSFTVFFQPGIESGLDRFTVKVSHTNKGGGKGNEEPALIMLKEGIFCPPEYTQ